MTEFIISHTKGVEYAVGKDQTVTLSDLCEMAKRTRAPTKDLLPMIIAGSFDNTRERKNEHMTSVSCIMGDHDAGTMTVEQAAVKLSEANLHGAIISSPRHMMPTNKGTGPRWRLVVPLAKPISIREHLEFAERVNGIFGKGVLGIEGKAVSRPYYIGSIADGKPIECKVVEGRLLDECPAGEFPRIRFPKSACDAITFPDVAADATTTELANAILEGIKNFDAGHEGLKPACVRIAPFVRMGIISGDVVAELLQEQLEATSSRSGVPENEAARTLNWAVYSCDAIAKICKPWSLGEKDVDTLAREIWAKHSDPNTDFGALDDAADDYDDDEALRNSVVAALSLAAWDALDIPPTRQFLGDMLVNAGRVFFAGPTGLGKTQIAHGIAAGIASGNGFLHWKCDSPARVLLMDGEMSARLVKQRLRDIKCPAAIPPGNLVTFAMDRAEWFSKAYPQIGDAAALNTPEGIDWFKRLVKLIKPDVIIFDNLMSLTEGDQTTEIPWKLAQPLVSWLRSRDIAQLWIDHTGLNRSRMYGSSTKLWPMDAAAMLLDPPDTVAKAEGDIAFVLSFEAPAGKARERCKENWTDFAPMLMRRAGDGTWSAERVDPDVAKAAGQPGGMAAQRKAEGKANEAKVFAKYIVMREESANSPVTIEDLAGRCAEGLDISKAARRGDRKKAAIDIIARLIDTGSLGLDGENVTAPAIPDDDDVMTDDELKRLLR